MLFHKPVTSEQVYERLLRRKKMKTKKRMLIVLLTIMVVLLVGVAIVLNERVNRKAEVGTKEYETKEIIETRKKEKVDKSVIAATMEQVISFEDGKSEGELNIENLPENNYEIEVEIVNNKQEVLYKSERIEPGMIIRKDKLKVELSRGKYLCGAKFKAYDEEGKEVKQVSAQIEIQVKK